jgi:serine/threonine-protein kinase
MRSSVGSNRVASNSAKAELEQSTVNGPLSATEAELTVPSLDAQDVAIGTTICGKYRIESVIGSGAMGVVVAARHLELEERVALKFIRPHMQGDPGVVSRFAREAKASVRITSDHVVKVLDIGTAERFGPFIVMEYLEGQDLAQRLTQRGPLSPRVACEYAMQACEALALAHSLGITHRDIKPGNLFSVKRGELELIKVLDFGISKAALTGNVFGDDLSLVETTGMMGTPLYMSPEQIRATGEVDARSDIWSLGATLYELLTGKAVFLAETVMQVCALVLENEPLPMATHGVVVAPELERVVMRCLRKDVGQRYASVAELARDLAPFAPTRARVHSDRASSILQSSPQDSLHDTFGLARVALPGATPANGDVSEAAQSATRVSASASLRDAKLSQEQASSLAALAHSTRTPASEALLRQNRWLRSWGLLAVAIALLAVAFVVERATSPFAPQSNSRANSALDLARHSAGGLSTGPSYAAGEASHVPALGAARALGATAPGPVAETPVAETPVAETPVAEAPVAEAPVAGQRADSLRSAARRAQMRSAQMRSAQGASKDRFVRARAERLPENDEARPEPSEPPVGAVMKSKPRARLVGSASPVRLLQ